MVHNDCSPKEIIEFDDRNLQHEFSKHAKDLGIGGNWNKKNAELFKKAILDHINDANTIKMPSAYRGTPTTLYYNASTGVGVQIRLNNQFWTCWKLSLGQLMFNNLL